MINIDDMTAEFDADLKRLCVSDPFGTRILALRSAYCGKKYDFLDFWIQRDDNNKSYSCFCLYSSTMIICGEPFDLIEASEFLQMLSPSKIMCRNSIALQPDILGMNKRSGEIMKFGGNTVCESGMYKVSLVSSSMSELKKIYRLLDHVFGLDRIVFEDFFLSMSHMIRHNTAEIYAVYNEKNEPVSTAFVIYKTDQALHISSVATEKPYRKRGMAEEILKVILKKHNTDNKKIFLQREAPITLYDTLGFKKCGEWAEYAK